MALDEALDRVMRAYDKERLHAAPTDVIAQHIGYKTANNGAALQALASMRYYGLLDRPRDGQLAVAKDVEAFRFAPNEELRRAFILRFLRTPPLFAELLDKYTSGLPSEGNLKYELINRGFLPTTASTLVSVFKRSVEFARYFDAATQGVPSLSPSPLAAEAVVEAGEERMPALHRPAPPAAGSADLHDQDAPHDRIPIRLHGGRRAWLVIPAVFYESDKARIKAQIDLLLTEDDEA
jgi:hypothetical protein